MFAALYYTRILEKFAFFEYDEKEIYKYVDTANSNNFFYLSF